MKKISVIIPVYNVENYLSACLTSCMQQTLRDVEFVCVNDGSKDHSPEILKAYQKQDCRFKIIEKENGGLSSARKRRHSCCQRQVVNVSRQRRSVDTKRL